MSKTDWSTHFQLKALRASLRALQQSQQETSVAASTFDPLPPEVVAERLARIDKIMSAHVEKQRAAKSEAMRDVASVRRAHLKRRR